MRLHALDIPDDPTERAGWLERHLLGLDLAALVAELEAVHGTSAEGGTSVREALGPRLDAVLTGGLTVLPAATLGTFLRRPRSLLELQDLVLTSGGDYWDRLGPPSDDHAAQVERGGKRLSEFLAGRGPGVIRAQDDRPFPGPVAWYRRPWFVALATAASVLVAVLAYDRSRGPAGVRVAVAPPAWGWSRPDALPQDLPPPAYLDHLATAAAEWFKKRPEGSLSLAKRVAEFRQGCSVLILSEHRPLSAADRRWLVEKCRAWAAKLDAHLAAVEAGVDPTKVRAEADETVRKLITALQARAKERASA